MNTSRIQELLDELYSLDPQLKTHEAELLKLLPAIIRAKPQVHVDQVFKNELAQSLMVTQPQRTIFQPRLLAGMLVLCLVLGGGYLTLRKPGKETPQVTALGPAAFGTLVNTNVSGSRTTATTEKSYGGGLVGDLTISDRSKEAVSSAYFSSGFSYPGTLPTLKATGNVYKTNTEEVSLASLPQAQVGGLSASNKVTVTTLSYLDDEGSLITVSPDSITILRNAKSQYTSYTREAATPSDLLSDETLISIASSFLTQKGISLNSFSSGVVDSTWKAYSTSAPSMPAYIPTEFQVTFPMQIEGKPVYTSSGTQYGITVAVSGITKEVTTATIPFTTFVSSEYALETNGDTIKQHITNGGGLPIAPFVSSSGSTGAGDAEISQSIAPRALGEPVEAYTVVFLSSEPWDGQYYVPAYAFTAVSADPGFPEKVIVPLVPSLYDAPLPTTLPPSDSSTSGGIEPAIAPQKKE